MRKAQLGQPTRREPPVTTEASPEGAQRLPRRSRRKRRLRAVKDATNRWAKWTGLHRKDPQRGERTQAALAATGLGDRNTGTLNLQAWFAAIPLDVYEAVLAADTWKKDWQIEAPQSNAPKSEHCSAPGRQLVAYLDTGATGEAMLRMRFHPEEGGTRLELMEQGVPAERIPTLSLAWQRTLLDPLAERFGH